MNHDTAATELNESTLDQIARVVFNEDIRAMVIAEKKDDEIQSRILADLERYGISPSVASALAPTALAALKQAMAEGGQFPTGLVSSFLHEKKNVHRDLVRSHLEPGEILFCVEQVERRAPFLIRVIPIIGDLAKFGARHLLISVTDSRVLVLQLGVSRLKPVVKREVASIPLEDLKEVVPKKGLLTSSLKLVTRTGKKFRYPDLLKSAADRLAGHIHDSFKQQVQNR